MRAEARRAKVGWSKLQIKMSHQGHFIIFIEFSEIYLPGFSDKYTNQEISRLLYNGQQILDNMKSLQNPIANLLRTGVQPG